jgi:hypothetical protein
MDVVEDLGEPGGLGFEAANAVLVFKETDAGDVEPGLFGAQRQRAQEAAAGVPGR